jgi:biotin carboxyl carrier protein
VHSGKTATQSDETYSSELATINGNPGFLYQRHKGNASTASSKQMMTAADGLRKGASKVFEEFFIEVKIADADVKSSFPYNQTTTNEDTADDPVEKAAHPKFGTVWNNASAEFPLPGCLETLIKKHRLTKAKTDTLAQVKKMIEKDPEVQLLLRTREGQAQLEVYYEKLAKSDSTMTSGSTLMMSMEKFCDINSSDYVSAGTVKYLYLPAEKKYYFLEVNPRLQVEHPNPITEGITGVSLLATQVHIAMGTKLYNIPEIRRFYGQDYGSIGKFDLSSFKRHSHDKHVIAARITADNPDEGMTIEYLGELLETDAFMSNTIDTAWLDGIIVHKSVVITIVPTSALISAAVFRADKQMIQGGIANFKGQLSTLPLKELQSIPVDITYADVKYSFRMTPKAPDTMVLKMGAQSIEMRYREQADGSIYAAYGVESHQVFAKEEALGLRTVLDGVAVLLPTLYDPRSDITGKLVEDGASVKKGETFPEAEAMKMIITLNATESGVIKHEGDMIKHEKPAGSIINQGDLLASLTLADPPRDKKIGTFSGTLENATGEEMVAGSATLKRFRKAQKTLELVMDGYVLDAEPAVQAMLSALASVSLPIEEIKDAASALGQKMPVELDAMMQRVYAATLAEHVNGMDSTETANLVTKVRSVVEEYVMSPFESKQANVRIIIAPVTAQIDKCAKGLRENAIDVMCALLSRYVNVESTFVDMSIDQAVGALVKANPKDLQKVYAMAFAHEQLKGRNLLVISMLRQLSGFPERFGVEPLGTLPPALNVVVTLSQMPGAAYKEVALTAAKFGLMKAEKLFDEAVRELKAELKSAMEEFGATATPFDGDKVPLRGSRQPVLRATSSPPPSFLSLDTSVLFSDNNCNDCDDGGPGSEFPMCVVGTDCGDCGVRSARSASPPPPPQSPATVCMISCLNDGGSSCHEDGGGPVSEFATCAYPPSPPPRSPPPLSTPPSPPPSPPPSSPPSPLLSQPRVSMPSPPPRSPAVHPAPNPPPNICSNPFFVISKVDCRNMVLCPCLSTAVGGTGLYRNPAGNSTIDPCAIYRGSACTCAGRNSMTADNGLREGARQVFEIAIEELFIESELWNADVKYSFPYEDTAGVPVDEGAKRNGAPLRWVECFDGALVLLRLGGLLVYAVCSEQERSGRNTRFVMWSKNNRSYRNEWVILALLALIVPGVSAMATTALLDGDGTGAAHRAEPVQMQPRWPPPPTRCADDVNSGALDASGAPLPCSYFGAQPSACASYSIARTKCPVACGTCPPDPQGVVFSTGAETSHRALAVGMHAVQLNHRRAQQAQAGVAPSPTSALSSSAGSSLVTAPPFPRSPLPPLPASPTPCSLPPSSPSTPMPSPTRPPPRLSPPPLVLPPTLSLYPPDSGPLPWSSAPPPPMPLSPIPRPPHVRMQSQPPPSAPILSPPPLPCTVLPCTEASDIPRLYSKQLVPSHRRELQTAVSTSAGLLSALANTGVGRIVLAPGTYILNAELSITRSVILEAAVAGSVVLDAQASSSSPRRVLNINPGSLGVVQLIGLNITGGNVVNDVQDVRVAET